MPAVDLLPGLADHLPGVDKLVLENVLVHLLGDLVKVEISLLGEALVAVDVQNHGDVLVEKPHSEDVPALGASVQKEFNCVFLELDTVSPKPVAGGNRGLTGSSVKEKGGKYRSMHAGKKKTTAKLLKSCNRILNKVYTVNKIVMNCFGIINS